MTLEEAFQDMLLICKPPESGELERHAYDKIMAFAKENGFRLRGERALSKTST